MIPIIAAPSVISAASGLAGASAGSATPQPGHFLSFVSDALQGVSAQQSSAASAEAGYAAGVPGATLGKALVASDRAEVAWNATVAVRNEVVSAYQAVMNMQF
ncbi:MAG: flagellar hook-basal body complex protein FliE [Rhodospirillales bacterium]|nr:flagellar hook-basal body complex protein FliE [Rhodospirillales bacterium]